MNASFGRHIAIALAAPTLVLLACNAIIGIEDVRLKSSDTGGRGETGAGGGTLEDGAPADAEPLATDRATLALGFLHACARMPEGDVRCWGDNGAGQMGDGVPFDAGDGGPRAPFLRPKTVSGIHDAIAIGAGSSHTCVVHAAGNVSCWGLNAFGQLGDGTDVRSSKPVAVLALTDATAVVGGTSFTCALRKDKTVSCWGANYLGQLGDNTTDDRPTPAPVKDLAGVASLGAGTDHACAVLESGEVRCWGQNDHGQLGIGSTTESPVPVKLDGLTDIVQVAGAASFSCARERSGRVFCWGSNEFGQLGNGSPNPAPKPSPILVPGVSDAVWIWAGYDHACAVRRSGAVTCWGRGAEGQLGFGAEPADAAVPSPVAVAGAAPARAVWTGGDRSCAITQDGRAFCWGSNALGQLGNGTTDRAFSAVPVVDFP